MPIKYCVVNDSDVPSAAIRPSIGSAAGLAGTLVVVGDAAPVVVSVRAGTPVSWRHATVRIVKGFFEREGAVTSGEERSAAGIAPTRGTRATGGPNVYVNRIVTRIERTSPSTPVASETCESLGDTVPRMRAVQGV